MSQRPVSYVALGERTSPRWCMAFSAGCGGDIVDGDDLRPGPVAMFGSPKLWPILKQAQAEGRDWYYGDHAYWGRLDYYRIAKNRFQASGRHIQAPADRFEGFHVPILPWRATGSHVLVCAPDAPYARLMGFEAEGWLLGTVARLARYTDRPIRIRRREQVGKLPPLAADLQDCWALVTYASNAAVEAVLAGIPVICTAPWASATTMGESNLAFVESIKKPEDRFEWASALAYSQFTLAEMKAGLAWEWLQK